MVMSLANGERIARTGHDALAVWLREQRQARGLSRPAMARSLIQAAHDLGDNSVPGLDSMCHNIYRWERGADGVSERYKLYYCRALSIPHADFGTSAPSAEVAAPTPEAPNGTPHNGTAVAAAVAFPDGVVLTGCVVIVIPDGCQHIRIELAKETPAEPASYGGRA